jgi:hypothetical protein
LCLIGGTVGTQVAAQETRERIREILDSAPTWRDVLPDMIRTTLPAQQWLVGFLEQLRAAGFHVLRFGDLKGLLEEKAQADWTARHAVPPSNRGYEGDDDFRRLVILIRPDQSLEDRDSLDSFRRMMLRRIDKLDKHQKVRDRMVRILAKIVNTIRNTGSDGICQADLAKALEERKSTVFDDIKLLRDIAAEVRGTQ